MIQSVIPKHEYNDIKYEESFDSTKVGKKRNGRYLIIQGDKNSYDCNVICLEKNTLKEDQLRTIDKNHPNSLQKIYFYVEQKSDKPDGTVISTMNLLEDKLWYQIEPKTGEKLDVEHQYNKDGKFVRCVLPKNRRTQYPQWMLREFYFSDTVVTKFNRKQVGKRINGRYLVVNELDSDGSWQAATYDIATLSENRLELECVYPKGYATQVFV